MTSSNPAHSPLDRAVSQRLHALAKLTDRATQLAHEDGAGLPLGESRCLGAIGAFAPLSVNDLASRAALTKGQASRAAQSLVDQALVRKQASATDGRSVTLSLTAKGRRAWQRVMDVVERRNAEIVACLSEREQQQFDKLLDRLLAHARQAFADEDGDGASR